MPAPLRLPRQVLIPTPFVVIISLYEQIRPLRDDFREAVEKHPSFPPTLSGFMVCGHETNLPGGKVPPSTVPEDTEERLSHMKDMVDAKALTIAVTSVHQAVVHSVYECAYVWFVLDSTDDPEIIELFDNLIDAIAGFFHDFDEMDLKVRSSRTPSRATVNACQRTPTRPPFKMWHPKSTSTDLALHF